MKTCSIIKESACKFIEAYTRIQRVGMNKSLTIKQKKLYDLGLKTKNFSQCSKH